MVAVLSSNWVKISRCPTRMTCNSLTIIHVMRMYRVNYWGYSYSGRIAHTRVSQQYIIIIICSRSASYIYGSYLYMLFISTVKW